jgi:hypothetical protein
MRLRSVFALGLAISVILAAGPALAESGEDLAVFVLTFGPGDHPFFKFGHNAILVQPKEDSGEIYNFGTFQFDSPGLILKFLQGRFKYWLSVGGMDELAYYVHENRTIEAQELDLSPAQRLALRTSLRENARPENREYLYDYFRDNCSTRVRDAVDRVVNGRVRQAGQAPVNSTLRGDALRMTADFFPEYLGLDLGLGRSTDAPLSQWDSAFLPQRLHDLLRQVRMPSDSGDKPLVKSERTLFAAHRPAKPDQPPQWFLYFLLAGVGLGGALAGLGWAARGRRSARIGLGLTSNLLGFVLGLLGLILVGLWVLTDHKAAHANANIFLLAPWSLALSGFGISAAFGNRKAVRASFWLAATAAGLAGLGLAAKILPGYSQNNWALMAFFLPVWCGMAAGFHWLSRHAPPLPD